MPTTDTFVVIASEPQGGTGDLTKVNQQVIAATRAAEKTIPDARFGLLASRPSVLGGQIDCASLTTPREGVGQCWWVTPVYVVLVTTFSSNLRLDRALTEQIVNDLHGMSGGS
jgi:hypothetical protein